MSTLVRDILGAADDNVRPNADPGSPATNVSINLMLTGIKIEDDNEDVIRLDGYMSMKWSDPRLSWEPSYYDGISQVRLPVDQIWTPDITVYHSPDSQQQLFSPEHVVGAVSSNGDVLWVPKVTMLTYYNKTKTNNGTLYQAHAVLGSWVYDANALDYPADTHPTIDYTSYRSRQFSVQNSTIVRSLATYPCCEENYPRLDISIDLLKKDKD